MNYTNEQLRQLLAKMLPDVITQRQEVAGHSSPTEGCVIDKVVFHQDRLFWKNSTKQVLDTELLHLCWLVEETIIDKQVRAKYMDDLSEEGQQIPEILWAYTHATWQQRTIALAKVKGITI